MILAIIAGLEAMAYCALRSKRGQTRKQKLLTGRHTTAKFPASREEMTHFAYCSGRAEILCKTAPPCLGLCCLGLTLLHKQENRGVVVFPAQGEFGYVAAAAEALEGIFQVLDRRRRDVHVHLGPDQILRRVVVRSPLAGLLVDDQNPVVGIGDVDIETVRALG